MVARERSLQRANNLATIQGKQLNMDPLLVVVPSDPLMETP
jgi:hypothetical protein